MVKEKSKITKKEIKLKSDTQPVKQDRYTEAVGGRKTAFARVRLFSKTGGININGKPCGDYFRTSKNQQTARAPFDSLNLGDKFSATVKVFGGGLNAQAEAVRHGLSRALVKLNPVFKKNLRRSGFLTRDARMVERKKYGLKKARRAPQWAKR